METSTGKKRKIEKGDLIIYSVQNKTLHIGKNGESLFWENIFRNKDDKKLISFLKIETIDAFIELVRILLETHNLKFDRKKLEIRERLFVYTF